MADEVHASAKPSAQRLETATLLAVPNHEKLRIRESRGLDGQVHAFPRGKPANDGEPEFALRSGHRAPVRRVHAVADDLRAGGDGRSGSFEHGAHVVAHGDETVGAFCGPACKERSAGVEVVHHVVFGSNLGHLGTEG